MSNEQVEVSDTVSTIVAPKKRGLRFSLRTMLIGIVAIGAGLGILGRLLLGYPEIFMGVVMVLSTLVPFLLALGTLFWLGFRERRTGLIVWGGVLVLTPMVGIGLVVALQMFGGSPNGLGMLTTQRLINERLPNQIDQPWVWRELERRLQAGSLTNAQADAAVEELIAHMKATNPQGWDQPLSWQRDFLNAARQGDMISKDVLLDLCHAFYGEPSAKLPRLRESDSHFPLELEYGSNWGSHSGVGVELLWVVDRVLLDGEPIRIESVNHHRENWSGQYSDNISAGNHELTFEMECAYVDQEKMIGLNTHDLPRKSWPKARHRWKEIITVPVRVFSNDAKIVGLTTDPLLDPTADVQVERLVVQEGGRDGGKKIILKMKFLGGPSVPMSFDTALAVNGRTIPLGHRWIVRTANRQRSGGRESTNVDDLHRAITDGDVVLTPNPAHIEHEADVTAIWGKPIVIKTVPIEWLDLEAEEPAE